MELKCQRNPRLPETDQDYSMFNRAHNFLILINKKFSAKGVKPLGSIYSPKPNPHKETENKRETSPSQ